MWTGFYIVYELVLHRGNSVFLPFLKFKTDADLHVQMRGVRAQASLHYTLHVQLVLDLDSIFWIFKN